MNIKLETLCYGFLLTTLCILLNPINTFAFDSQVRLEGLYNFQVIKHKNNNVSKQKIVSRYKKKFGLNTLGYFIADYSLISDEGFKYGAKISLEHTMVNDRSVPMSVYLESDLGKLEAGSESGAGKKMRITSYAASCGIGRKWNTIISDYSRKISYYTPKMAFASNHKIQVGISYVPDSSNMGYDSINKTDYQGQALKGTSYRFAIKDGTSYGIAYRGKFTDILSVKLALVGEKGKSLVFNKKDHSQADIKFSNLNTYILGGELRYNNVSLTAAYADHNKSLTSPYVDLIGRDTYMYGLGVKYYSGKYAYSVNQFNSNQKRNKLSVMSLGSEYMVADGLKAYTNIVFYYVNAKYLEKGVIKSDNNKGMLIFLGAKVSF